MISAVLFDFNGTLIESAEWMALETKHLPRLALAHLAAQGTVPAHSPDHVARAESAFRAERQAANQSHRETSHSQNLRAVLRALEWSGHVADAEIEAAVEALQRACLPSVTLLPGAAEAVSELQTRGYRLGIVSNAAYPPFLHWTLEKFDLAAAFEQVFVSADLGHRKPGTEIFRIALQAMRLQPGEALYVGDDYEKDVVAPRSIGLTALWYHPQPLSAAPAGTPEADTVIASLSEIPRWLARHAA